MLQKRGIKTVIVCGASSNQAVMYTATAAVRPFGYTCVIPVDGLIARGEYEHEFTLHQFTILPGGAAEKFKITEFESRLLDLTWVGFSRLKRFERSAAL